MRRLHRPAGWGPDSLMLNRGGQGRDETDPHYRESRAKWPVAPGPRSVSLSRSLAMRVLHFRNGACGVRPLGKELKSIRRRDFAGHEWSYLSVRNVSANHKRDQRRSANEARWAMKDTETVDFSLEP